MLQATYFGKTNDFAFCREQKVRYKVSTPVYISCRLFRCLEETGGEQRFLKSTGVSFVLVVVDDFCFARLFKAKTCSGWTEPVIWCYLPRVPTSSHI